MCKVVTNVSGFLASLNTTVSFRSKSTSVVTKNEDDRLAKTIKNKSLQSSKRNQQGNHEGKNLM